VTGQAAWQTHRAFALVMLVLLLAMVRIVEYHWREGAAVIGGALLLAAWMRSRLPSERAGLLAIRSRGTDVFTYGAFGLLMLAVALTITGGPLAES
jgi:hypothetical protein